jgi:hypothetical protein
MDRDTRLRRLEYVKTKHKKQHDIVEALEAEKAPEESIAYAKRLKLSLKDEIASLETMLKAEGVEC